MSDVVREALDSRLTAIERLKNEPLYFWEMLWEQGKAKGAPAWDTVKPYLVDKYGLKDGDDEALSKKLYEVRGFASMPHREEVEEDENEGDEDVESGNFEIDDPGHLIVELSLIEGVKLQQIAAQYSYSSGAAFVKDLALKVLDLPHSAVIAFLHGQVEPNENALPPKPLKKGERLTIEEYEARARQAGEVAVQSQKRGGKEAGKKVA